MKKHLLGFFGFVLLTVSGMAQNCLQVQCPTNKSVQCGATWAFDQPTATTCCPNGIAGTTTNILITPISLTTNGACPRVVITQTWSISDGCNNTTNCSQTVTVNGCCATNCLQVQCPTNKSVACGASWSFDQPAVSTCCTNMLQTTAGTLTNVLVIPNGTVTNGSCPQVNITQSWLIVDGCGSSSNCSQTVTVLGCCSCLQVQCPSNKTVACGTTWSFDQPVASTCCTNMIQTSAGTLTNILVTSTGTVTNGSCPQVNIIQSWSISDGCGNSTNCSQTVTVTGCCSTNCLQVQCPTNKTVACGTAWSFDQPVASSCCAKQMQGTNGALTNVLITLTGLVTNGACPQLNITANWIISDGCGNSTNCSQTVTVTGCCSTNCLQVQCPTNKTVACGTTWSFDQPVATTCCTNLMPGTNGALTNILVTSTGIFTNGACPQLNLTATWSIHDGCGSSTNCSQTVTVTGCCASNCLQIHCPSNKTVPCGSAWTFDLPTATSCCTNLLDPPSGILTNVLITSISTVTNGTCPKVITQTWQIRDGCGDTNTCAQIVTVVDTTPPAIVCPTNVIVVAYNANCQLVIPAISVTATDACTPPCSLVYIQSPPAGAIVPGPTANVVVTVVDLCGNSNSCVAHVQGVYKTPPVVTVPASMTVTNCTVPCVPVTATAGCCPQNSLVISQSPACGTLVGPGVTSVAVKVTDCHGNTTIKIVNLIYSATESFLANLTNTGLGTTGLLLPDAAVDTHYTLPVSAVPAGMPADYNGNSVAVSDICHLTGHFPCSWLNTYVANVCNEYVPWNLPPDAAYVPAASKWIAPDYTNNGCCPAGNYTYTLNFTLPVGFNPATATLSGRWAADNGASLKINATTVATPAPGLSFWTPFTIPPGVVFVSGANALKFTVNNFGAWTGLRVEFTNAHANCFACVPPIVLGITPGQTLQVGSIATFNVIPGGTAPQTYQWYHNNVLIPGATNLLLQVGPVNLGDSGLYTIVISNPCGAVTGSAILRVTLPWQWPWGWWNVANTAAPLKATVGPDLNLVGSDFTTNYGINTGTTEDFGLPAPGGQIVNVMDINPEGGGAIQLPPITVSGETNDPSYTVVLDFYQPDTSLGTSSTLFRSSTCCVSNLGSSGQDGVGLILDSSNYLHIVGSGGGSSFDSAAATPLAADTWNRVVLVVDNPPAPGAATIRGAVNGGTVIIIHPCLCCLIPYNPSTINWNLSAPAVFTPPTNAFEPNGEFYVSSIQFHDIALPDEMIAGLGSPDNGPAPGSPTAAGPSPVLSAALVKGAVNISWTGSPYVLRETTDLGKGVWTDSTLPFTESSALGNILTTAVVTPAPNTPVKFYRLEFSP